MGLPYCESHPSAFVHVFNLTFYQHLGCQDKKSLSHFHIKSTTCRLNGRHAFRPKDCIQNCVSERDHTWTAISNANAHCANKLPLKIITAAEVQVIAIKQEKITTTLNLESVRFSDTHGC